MSNASDRQVIRTERQQRVKEHLAAVDQLLSLVVEEMTQAPGKAIKTLHSKVLNHQKTAQKLRDKLETTESLLSKILHPSQHAGDVEKLKSELHELDARHLTLSAQRLEMQRSLQSHRDTVPQEDMSAFGDSHVGNGEHENKASAAFRNIQRHNRSLTNLQLELNEIAEEVSLPDASVSLSQNVTAPKLATPLSMEKAKTSLALLNIPESSRGDIDTTSPIYTPKQILEPDEYEALMRRHQEESLANPPPVLPHSPISSAYRNEGIHCPKRLSQMSVPAEERPPTPVLPVSLSPPPRSPRSPRSGFNSPKDTTANSLECLNK